MALREVNFLRNTLTCPKSYQKQFELTFKPSSFFGSAFCRAKNGHKIVCQYANDLRLTNGLWLVVFREEAAHGYNLNYMEVTSHKDSLKNNVGNSKVVPEVLVCRRKAHCNAQKCLKYTIAPLTKASSLG